MSDFFDREKDNVNSDGYIEEIIKGHPVHIVKKYGFYGIHVYEEIDEGYGHHDFRAKQFKKLIPIFEDWCKKKGIKLTKR